MIPEMGESSRSYISGRQTGMNENGLNNGQSMVCIQCKQNITQYDELIDSLVIVQGTFCIIPHRRRKNFFVFTCRICDYADVNRENITFHLTDHFSSKEILYCNNCQDYANHLSLGFIGELVEQSIPYSLLLNMRKRLVQYTLRHVASLIPYCGHCNKCFGYLIPVLNRIVQRIDGRGYECNICSEILYHSKDVLKHAEQHVEMNELFCMDCINNYKVKEEMYFSSCVMKDKVEKLTLHSSKNIINTSLPSRSELQLFKDELLKSTCLPPPFPIALTSSESSLDSGEAVPQENEERMNTRNRIKRKKLPKPKTHKKSENRNASKETTCLTCLRSAIRRRAMGSTSSNATFICHTCSRDLGGWEYTRTNMFKRENMREKQEKHIRYFFCQICDFSCNTWAPMEKHVLSHLEKKEIYCLKCLQKINDKKDNQKNNKQITS